jgi:hypothetical protein
MAGVRAAWIEYLTLSTLESHRQNLTELYSNYLSYNIWGQFFADFRGHCSKKQVPPMLQTTAPVCLLGTITLAYGGQAKVIELETEGDVKLHQFVGWNNTDSVRQNIRMNQ